MKKILLTIFIVAGFFQLSQAQEVGIRFGDAFGGHYAMMVCSDLVSSAEFMLNVSFGNDGVGVEALWNFYTQPLGSGFDWYIALVLLCISVIRLVLYFR